MSKIDLLSKSADYEAMLEYWNDVDTFAGGTPAMRKAVTRMLPRFPAESDESYNYRLDSSVFTNIFTDITESLADKPFNREVRLADDGASPAITEFIEDVNSLDDHIHVFANEVMQAGVSHVVSWILVDYPSLFEGATLADERDAGVRPYWVRIEATDMLEVRSDLIGGREAFTYARMQETAQTPSGQVTRVRIFHRDLVDGQYQPARFELYEQEENNDFTLIDEGSIAIGFIPLVPFYTGKRKLGTWRFTMPLQRVSDLQIQHYQADTSLKLAKEQTAFPMLKGEGISPPIDENGNAAKLPVGPGAVLYAPMNEDGQHGTWNTIEPSSSSLIFLASEVQRLETSMRELGRQPLTAGSAGLTQVAAAFASQRASSAVQAWAMRLKDALETALKYTCMWLGTDEEPTVYINSDFAIELGDDRAPELILQLFDKGIISTQTLIQEMKRRGILSPEVDSETEALSMLNELTSFTEDDGVMPDSQLEQQVGNQNEQD